MDEPDLPIVRTQAELEAVWIRLMGPWGFDRRSVWMIRLDADRRALPVITEIAECDEAPDPESANGLAQILTSLDEDDPGGSFAFLLSRSGSTTILDEDRAWGRMLLEAGSCAGVRLDVLHLSTDAGTVPLPPDELSLRRTA